MVNLYRSNPIFSGLLRDYLKINDRALKNYFSLSDYTPAYRRQGFQKNDSKDFSLLINASLICAIGSKSM